MPEILCFNAPVKQRRNHLPQVAPVSRRAQVSTTAMELGGIYLGEKPVKKTSAEGTKNKDKALVTKNLSSETPMPVPPPKPPRSDLQVLRDLMSAQTKEKFKKSIANSSKQSICSIVRSVSDYKTFDSVLTATEKTQSIRKSRTDIFHVSPGICLNFFKVFF